MFVMRMMPQLAHKVISVPQSTPPILHHHRCVFHNVIIPPCPARMGLIVLMGIVCRKFPVTVMGIAHHQISVPMVAVNHQTHVQHVNWVIIVVHLPITNASSVLPTAIVMKGISVIVPPIPSIQTTIAVNPLSPVTPIPPLPIHATGHIPPVKIMTSQHKNHFVNSHVDQPAHAHQANGV